jgi:hypothetical protein
MIVNAEAAGIRLDKIYRSASRPPTITWEWVESAFFLPESGR